MPVTLIKPSFSAGELSPSIYGRTDFAKWHVGASVMRNMFVSYRGPASSRAGTLWAGQSLTPASASSLPPKIVRFQFNIFQSYILEFGQDISLRSYMRVIANGAYVTESPVIITGANQANPCQITAPGHGYSNGDWVFITGVTGMTQLNLRTFVVQNVTANTFNLFDTFGNGISSLAYGTYISGGTVSRIYTNFEPPYKLADLPYLKVVQSADVMSLCCVNQQTGTEYPPYDLQRLAANNWNFVETTFASSIDAPTGATASTTVTGSPATQYAYCVTAVDAVTGEESIASNVANITNSDDLALVSGSHIITWNPVAGASSYNIYQAPPSYDTPVPAGSNFGYIGTAFGTQFVNTNIQADLTVTPPLHQNPFAQGTILSVTITNQGSGYTQATCTATITSSTGTGAVLLPVVVSGHVVAIIVQNGGEGYQATDTVTINGQGTGSGAAATVPATPQDGTDGGSLGPVALSNGGSGYVSPTATVPAPGGSGTQATLFPPVVVGGVIQNIYVNNPGTLYTGTQTVTITDTAPPGSGATATLNVGPQSGTFPSVPNYFQSRRVYANTTNNPDTMFFSQTGAYQNMDSATPPIDSDAIVTTPWGQQVNGVQWLQPMPGGLIAATGLDAWQVSGSQGAGSTLTPSQQSAQPQESNGFSPIVQPLKINYDILYVQALGYVVRDLQYNFFTNIYAGTDISVLSNHLFEGYQITQWAWAKTPWKVVWATRNDGKFLSLTFDKEEQLQGWARHDTNGLVQGNEVATEPPVDAPYFVVKRYIPGYRQWAYYIERMDNRLWVGPEDPWCVDAGLALAQQKPNATLSASAADGPGIITGGYIATGGTNYSDPSAQVIDPLGQAGGTGAVITLTQTGGVITGFAIVNAGEGYSPGTAVKINDPTGAGATLVPLISQNVLFNASATVFGDASEGDVIRIGGGQATVQQVNSLSQVLASITVPISQTVPNDPNRLPVPAPAGEWSISTPVSQITNLYHLEGMTVTGLADGTVIPPQVVQNGTISLPAPASAVTVGLPFVAQLQGFPIEIQPGTVQGKRKMANGLTIRVEKSKGFELGANQPVASFLDFQQEIAWAYLVGIPEVPQNNVPDAALPLFTGDKYVSVNDDWQNWNGWEAAPGMIAAQQLLPLPLNVLAFITTVSIGDT